MAILCFVIVMSDHTEGSNDRGRGIRMVDRGFLFQRNESFKICRLISQESLSRSVIERYYKYIFFDEIDSRKATLVNYHHAISTLSHGSL